jgi:hypothetical protein
MIPGASPTLSPEAVRARLEALIDAPEETLSAAVAAHAEELLLIGEAIVERWLLAQGVAPTQERSEGLRLLALHRQGAKGDPSFNACRESCRELVYHSNLVRLDPGHPESARRIRLGAMVAGHLALFIEGKLEMAGLGEFCCSSRSLREQDRLSSQAPPRG